MTDKQIYQIGLTMINGVGDILARHLLEALGDAEAVFTEKRQSLEKIPGIGDSIIAEIKRADVLLRAEKELAFAQKNGISIYFLKDWLKKLENLSFIQLQITSCWTLIERKQVLKKWRV